MVVGGVNGAFGVPARFAFREDELPLGLAQGLSFLGGGDGASEVSGLGGRAPLPRPEGADFCNRSEKSTSPSGLSPAGDLGLDRSLSDITLTLRFVYSVYGRTRFLNQPSDIRQVQGSYPINFGLEPVDLCTRLLAVYSRILHLKP